ncbi:MAG: FAD-dependent oxidoreductase [Myxococcota bacterium]|jgi:2,4-dienoyl-CoA reductase (NADPH2)|nr:FAD-dependent oxidoreductase [Myxococcota bacterium]
MPELSSLFSPIKINQMELPNRIVMAPMTVDYALDDETPSDRQLAYYSERAAGGPAMINLEVCSVDADHRYQQHSLGLHSDFQIEKHKKLVDVIHAHGVKCQPQLSHPGPESLAPFYKQLQPMGPSPARAETTRQLCREIAPEEIEAVIEMYGEAARRSREAGYDGIELHAAHGYMMLGSFLSPLRNFRTDEYAGGKFEGRAKLLLDVLARIRQKVGGDYPITLRMSGFERQSGGREINDSQRLAPLLVDAGVDCFHVSGGVGDANITQIITGPEYGAGFNVSAAEAIKQVVDVPVLVVGQNMDPVAADRLIEEGRVDMIAMARSLLCDPELPNKAKSGRLREINRCNVCQGCTDMMTSEFNGAACSLNPRAGKEADYPLEKAAASKKVVVVGGGPAGMAAAMYASDRGHQVTLLEREGELGGAFRLASTLFPGNQLYLDFLRARMEDLPVEVRLETEANEASIKELGADAVIVATGGRFTSPDIAGDDAPNVLKGKAVLDLVARMGADPSDDDLGLEGRVVIVGANLIGMELAEALAARGKQVHLVEPSGRMAMPAGKKRRADHCKQLDRLGVPVNTGVAVKEITAEGVVLSLAKGRESTVRAGTVILVGHPEADSLLEEKLAGVAETVRSIGDAVSFGLTQNAARAALDAAYSI